MDSGYVEPSLAVDPEDVAQESFDYMATQIPGWEPHAGSPDTHLIEASARPAAQAREAALETMRTGFREYGVTAGIPAQEATRASVTSTWTVDTDEPTYTIPDGTQVLINGVGFETDGEVEIVAPATSTAAGEVVLVAIDAGAAGNDLAGPASLVDGLPDVTSIALVGTSSGGQDAETDTEFEGRLAEELELASPMPLTARDCAVLARRVSGVHRAVGIDNYNPNTGATDAPWTCAVSCLDEDGAPVAAGVKTAVATLIEGLRGQNFNLHVFDATTTGVDVQYAGVSLSDWDPDEVKGRVDQAISDYLNPASWGRPPGGGEGEWEDELVVRLFEVAEVINRVDGFHHLTSLTMRKGADPYAAADVAISGPAALAEAGTITGTVTAP